jgi:molecular chaperone HtpG
METFEFKAEIKEILDILIHSLYTQRDIFLRELISNASDAIDKLKLHYLINGNKIPETPFQINIAVDSPNKKLIVSDNGIGMTRDEVLENLGTLAHSGTKKFLDLIKNKNVQNLPELIGQFGVGFYSVFMVADTVEVLTKSAITDSPATKWLSKGDGSFSIEESAKETHGTDIILHLKKGEEIYLSENKIREIVKKYSDFIEYPIYFIKGSEQIQLNSQVAFWRKNKNEITTEDYNNFYKQYSYDPEDPLDVIHYRGEGLVEFTALLYIPSKKPFDIYMKDFEYGPALYINKVLIMNHCQELIPPYLRFLKGVVEADGLTLNVSREYLQNNAQISTIRNNITKKVLEHLESLLKNEREKYIAFYKEFGKILKEGIFYESDKKDKLASLIIAETTKTKVGEYISLDEYYSRMQIKQDAIYFLPGKDTDSMRNSPYLEIFKEKDIEVLLLTDDFDDLIMTQLNTYKGKEIKSVLSSNINLEDSVKDNSTDKANEFIKYIKEVLSKKVMDVKISKRLKDSVGVIVNTTGLSANTINAVNINPEIDRKILEINLDHPLVAKLKNLWENNQKDLLNEYILLMFNIALLESNYNIENPTEFKNILISILEQSLINLQNT